MDEPLVFVLGAGEAELTVRCHISSAGNEEAAVSESILKATLAAQNLENILQEARSRHEELAAAEIEIVPQTLALMDSKEPVLYASVSDLKEPTELHVSLTEEIEYSDSELIRPWALLTVENCGIDNISPIG